MLCIKLSDTRDGIDRVAVVSQLPILVSVTAVPTECGSVVFEDIVGFNEPAMHDDGSTSGSALSLLLPDSMLLV